MYKKSKKMQWGDPTSQSDANFAKGQLVEPNRHICVMCLEQAVEDLQRHRGTSAPEPQRLYVQARRWVASNDRRWPYSFANVCDMLNMSCGRMRTKLLAEHPTATLDVVGAGVPLEVVGSADVDLRDEAPLEEELRRLARA